MTRRTQPPAPRPGALAAAMAFMAAPDAEPRLILRHQDGCQTRRGAGTCDCLPRIELAPQENCRHD